MLPSFTNVLNYTLAVKLVYLKEIKVKGNPLKLGVFAIEKEKNQ